MPPRWRASLESVRRRPFSFCGVRQAVTLRGWAAFPAWSKGSTRMQPRFTLGILVGLVVLCGVGFAALREANGLWASCLFTLTLGVLGLACLGGAFRRGPSQAFFVGFAGFGIAYVYL